MAYPTARPPDPVKPAPPDRTGWWMILAAALLTIAGIFGASIVDAEQTAPPPSTDILDEIAAAVAARDAGDTADAVRIAELEAALAAATATSTSPPPPPSTPTTSTTSTSSTSSTTTTTSTTTTLPPASPSGQPMPTGDLPGWRYVMGEDFDVDVALGTWSTKTTYADTIGVYPSSYFDTSRNTSRPSTQWGQYDPARTLSVTAGVLDKWLHTEGTRPKVAALLPFLGAHTTATDWSDQLYGRYTVRYRITNPMPGYKQAWLLWPESNNGRTNGEIDFPEIGFDTLGSVGGYVHHINGTSGSDQYAMPTKATDLRQWHTATVEWTPNLVRFLWDGAEIGRTTDRIPNTPMHWVIQTETAVTSTAPAATTEGHVQIDWVAVWKPT